MCVCLGEGYVFVGEGGGGYVCVGEGGYVCVFANLLYREEG